MWRPRTLAARTGLTLAVALVAFLLFSLVVVAYYVLLPVGMRAADDLAGLIMLSAQTWVELPPDTRPDFERELLASHGLRVSVVKEYMPSSREREPYLHFLADALAARIGEKARIRASEAEPDWLCTEVPTGGRILRVCFARDRVGDRPPEAALMVALAGTLMILVTTLLLVRRLTLPLARMAEATGKVARGERLEPLPETGPTELAALARSFNRMAVEVSELLANRTTLLAGISHDLRTPIARMQIALELLPEESDPSLVEGLRHDLQEMDHLIGQALELARGLEQREIETIDLRELIDAVVTDQRRGGARIRWSPAECCLWPVQPLALRRVLTNLVENAVRYGADKPVLVDYECGADEALIRVLDRGPGIPADQREAVFRPFHRLDASRNHRFGGSGLGLAIARQLCEPYGWGVELLPRPGGGTEAHIRLPARVSDDETAVSDRAPVAAPN